MKVAKSDRIEDILARLFKSEDPQTEKLIRKFLELCDAEAFEATVGLWAGGTLALILAPTEEDDEYNELRAISAQEGTLK